MRTWTRAQGPMLCGFNPEHQIERGDPVLLIVIDSETFKVEKRRFRCCHCAGEPIPADLPLLQEHKVEPATATPHGFTPVRRLAGLPLDWAQKASGERDPGEEG